MATGGTPSWGAPASGAPRANLSTPEQNTLSPNDNESRQHVNSPNPGGYQRHSPYPNNSHRGRQGNSKTMEQNPYRQQGSFSPGNPFQNQEQKLSSNNPFQSSTPRFSSGNPYHDTVQNSRLDSPSFCPGNQSEGKQRYNSPSNRFQRGGQFPTRNRHYHPRQRFQSNNFPYPNSPGGSNPRFSPRTPSNSFGTPPQEFNTGSPRHPQRTPRGGFDSSKRPFQKNRNMGNPGGSDNIRDYVHPSMLEDPWKDLPATPMLHSY